MDDFTREKLIRGKTVKGVPVKNDRKVLHGLAERCHEAGLDLVKRTDYRSENELMFHNFHKLSLTAYSSLLEQTLSQEGEILELKMKCDESHAKYAELNQDFTNTKKQLKDLQKYNTSITGELSETKKELKKVTEELSSIKQQLRSSQKRVSDQDDEFATLRQQLQQYECRMCPVYKEDQKKLDEVVKALKQCDFVANASLDNDANVLKRMRAILGRVRHMPDSAERHEVTNGAITPELTPDEVGKSDKSPCRPTQPESGFCSNETGADETMLPGTDDESSLLQRPEYVEEEEEDDGVRIVPETVPHELFTDDSDDPTRINTQKFFKNSKAPCSPISKATRSNSSVRAAKVVTPPPTKEKASLDESYCSPTIFDLPGFTRQIEPSALPVLSLPKDDEATSGKLKPPTERKSTGDPKDDAATGANSKPPAEKKATRDPPVVELPSTPVAKKYKQTTLSRDLLGTKTSSTGQAVVTRPKITMRIAPPNELREPKRKRKGKEPEDWSCKECYRLLLEAEANGKIDRRKHDIAMNFCGDHINRMSYYLNTPPGFWNCNEMPPPRNGHLHPLIVPDSDDDDFVKDSKSK